MAGVPTYDNRTVSPTAPDPNTIAQPDTSAMGAPGRQLQQFGGALQGAGETYGKMVVAEQEKANDLRVIDAENQAREEAIRLTVDPQEGYANVQGGDVMHRASGQPLAVEYKQKFDSRLGEIAQGLTNDVQRQAFQRSATALSQDFYGKVSEHEATEYRGYQQSVLKGSAEIAGQEIALHYSDPDTINTRLQSLDVATAKLGQLNGMSGNEIIALQNTARSQALTGAISAALDGNDVATAQSLYATYGDKLLAPDKGKIEGPLQREATGQMALSIAGQVFNEVPGAGVDQPAVEKVFSALVNQESSGRAGVAGPMTKWGQAHGLTQVLDTTGAGIAKQLGVQWRPDLMRGASEEAKQYQLQIGRAYFQQGLQKYGGDVYKALCYYHGGPDERQWGPKTHTYADTIIAKCGGKPGSATVAAPTLEDAINAAHRMLPPGATYDQIKAVDEEVSRQWQVHKSSQDYAEEQSVSGAMTALLKNGGNINGLDAPTRNAIPGDKWDSVIGFARSVQAYGKEKRDPAKDDALYNQAITDPHALAAMSDSQFLHTYAGMGRFDDVAKYRAQLQGKMPTGKKDDSGTLNYTTINAAIDSRLQSIGVDPKDDKVAGQVGAVRRTLNGAIAGEQRRLGRQMTDAETESFVDRQFSRPGVIHKNWLGAATNIPLFAVDVDHIPTTDRQQIEDALDRMGQPHTDGNILALYYAGRTR